MDKTSFGLIVVVLGSSVVALVFGLKYSQATVLFGLIAVLSAPIAIHKVEQKNWSSAMLLMLAMYASFPLKRLLQLDTMIGEVGLYVFYAFALWVIGFGWKRSWS